MSRTIGQRPEAVKGLSGPWGVVGAEEAEEAEEVVGGCKLTKLTASLLPLAKSSQNNPQVFSP
jgi:hypothetical protein